MTTTPGYTELLRALEETGFLVSWQIKHILERAAELTAQSVAAAQPLASQMRPQSTVQGWQPIETAPQDETLFLAGWAGSTRMCVIKGSILHAQKTRAVPTPEHLQFQCTHWMPLPDAPQPPQGEG